MSDEYRQFEQRKQDHIDLALMAVNQAEELNDFDTLTLIHEALPDLNFSEIDLSTKRFQREVAKPFMVASMTAGHRNALKINQHLLAACAEQGWAMGVGSQRRELSDKDAAFEWQPLRKLYPEVSLFSNLGIAQLISSKASEVQALIDNLQAEAIIIHCNPLQECIQPEGTPAFKGCFQALEQLVRYAKVPVIVKETGCGFSLNTLKRLNQIGVAAVDVSGLGGTHWGRIEGHRAEKESVRQSAAKSFRNWGITSLCSVKTASSIQPDYEIWGSGGLRNGLDAAKLIALGASTIGFAKQMLDAALLSAEAVQLRMATLEYELKVAMFCTGSRVLSDLRNSVCL